MSFLVLDTHSLVWFLQKDPRLPARARKAILSADYIKIVPLIVFCEIHYLHAHGRFPLSLTELMHQVGEAEDFELAPHTEDQLSYLIKELDIHDGLIVATARAVQEARRMKVQIVSRDDKIEKYAAVPVLWD